MTEQQHEILRQLDALILTLQEAREAMPAVGGEIALSITKAQEAKHWLLAAWSE